jgi:hypothetical protein
MSDGPQCAQCDTPLEQLDPVDGGSDPTTDHEGWHCPDCGASGALVVREGGVCRRIGPALDATYGMNRV